MNEAGPESVITMATRQNELADSWRTACGKQAANLLLAWYDRSGRKLPWRQNKDPYRVWLSETMLQQTRVQTAIPYFEAFLRRWPTLADLAEATPEQVLKNWEGLGYYARARHLLDAAVRVYREYGGSLPASEKALLALPGIGEYTACAILSIAFSQPAAAVDGNGVRVFSRLTAVDWQTGNAGHRREVRSLAEAILPADRPGDWNEALMDFGATVCLPRNPLCPTCPLAMLCRAGQAGKQLDYPRKANRKSVPVEERIVLVQKCGDRVLVRKRPPNGLLAGLYEFCWLDSQDRERVEEEILRLYPGSRITPLGNSLHTFSHLQWRLRGYLADTADKGAAAESARWVDRAELDALPFPVALEPYREKVLEILWHGQSI